ncbi:MAG: 2-oxoacid:acceptor oxidoreductase family protein [Candidatus Methylomirabilales bacterium]
MGKTLEIRWHARAGQGAVTAAKTFAEAALGEGKYIQASPEYGPERAGAPMRAFNRVADVPIRLYGQVQHPDVVVVVDPTLLMSEDVLEGTAAEATLLVNTPLSPAEVRTVMKMTDRKIFTVDATKIALEEIGKNFPNTPMLGAVARLAGQFSVDSALAQVKASLGKKVPPQVVDGNLRAVQRGYGEVKGEGPDGLG